MDRGGEKLKRERWSGLSLLAFFFCLSLQAGPTGEQSETTTSKKSSDIPASVASLMEVADQVSSAVGVKTSESHLKEAEKKTGQVEAPTPAPTPAAKTADLEPVTPAQVLGPKVASSSPVGEVAPAADKPASETTVPENNNKLLGSIGNAKAMSDALAPIVKTTPTLPARDTRVSKPNKGTGFPNKPAKAEKKAEKEERDPEVMPGTPGDTTAGKTDFGARGGDTLASLSSGGSGLGDSSGDKKDDKDKDKKPADEEKRLQEQLADALNGELNEKNYNTVADQILNNQDGVQRLIASNPAQRANAINLIRKFAPQDTNKSRGQAAQRFASELEQAGNDSDAPQPRQLAPRRDGIHNQ